jgi:cytochrome c peroxidase
MFVSHVAFAAPHANTTYEAGHPSIQDWLLPEKPPAPADNEPNEARITLGKQLFFDARVSRDGNMSCATCHNPLYGWSDGLPTAKGFKSEVLTRASPTIVNTAYNSLQMWDGRKKDLEDQATGPMEASAEMNSDMPKLLAFLNQNESYRASFEQAYPGQAIDKDTLAKAIASFERTIISNNSPFDRWVKGEKAALTAQQIRGFALFNAPDKGNCSACHSGPNFTDNGFHNLGLASFGSEHPDLGRFAQRPLGLMKGAFKTPTLRDVAKTPPYFHDGSAPDLMAVMAHYNKGGEVKSNLSPNMKTLNLSEQEQQDIVAFMQALSSPTKPFTLPVLPI